LNEIGAAVFAPPTLSALFEFALFALARSHAQGQISRLVISLPQYLQVPPRRWWLRRGDDFLAIVVQFGRIVGYFGEILGLQLERAVTAQHVQRDDGERPAAELEFDEFTDAAGMHDGTLHAVLGAPFHALGNVFWVQPGQRVADDGAHLVRVEVVGHGRAPFLLMVKLPGLRRQ
jgi:hypothetical protein